MRNKEIPLKIEVFSQDEEDDFILRDPKEILAVLRDIAQQHNRVALYYNEDSSMVLTLLLAVDEHGLWVDAAPNPADNRHIERSQRIVFVSTHNQAKVQWISTETTQGLYQNSAAFYLPLPRKLLRLQRRDYYRLVNPEPQALKCRIRPSPTQRHRHHDATIMDISIGGVALTCTEEGVALTPGTSYPDCEIELPDVGTIRTGIEVKNVFEVTARNGEVKRRAGCVFVKPDAETRMMLQRYVAQAQLALARKKREEEE
jgi:c-di-GMP-binding flagellar brake protein YcgR